MRKTWLIFSQAVTVAVAVLFVVTTLKPEWVQRQRATPAPSLVSIPAPQALPVVPGSGGAAVSYSTAAKRASPAVVSITASKAPPHSPRSDDPLFQFFFGDHSRQMQQEPQVGLGSGVIVSSEGYLLTNNHVIDGADDIEVMLTDGRQARAKIVGTDPESDVAVLKIELDRLPTIGFGDADQLQVGDVVLAIGNPFGIGQTVTTGIVSAKGRGAMGLDYEDFIQTDAAINPGNSGGALVDADGRLVGINTAILSRSGGNQGIGFAIPVNLARDVMGSLIKDGHVTRGYLGVMIQDLTPALAKEFKLKDTTGALIGDVTPKGPADKAGLKSGDLLLEFNGKKVTDSRHLKLEVARTHPGQTVPVKILRDGDAKTLEVTVKTLPGTERVAKNDKTSEETGTLNGVGVADLDNNVRQQFDVPETVKGAVVTEVKPDSAAGEAGLKPGDVIQEINRKPVKNAEEAVRLTENPSDKTTLLRVWREGGSRFVVVDESKAG